MGAAREGRLDGEGRRALSQGFTALPEAAQVAAMAALVDRRPVATESIAETDLEVLRMTYPDLAQEWGGDARRKLAVAGRASGGPR